MAETPEFKDAVRAAWDENAAFWDENMGEGNVFHRQLIEPSILKLLDDVSGTRVLEIACGNGQLARKLTSLGAQVTATDFSPNMIKRARAHQEPFNDQIEYRVLDATDAQALAALGSNSFDAIVSSMALMDMENIEPLIRAVPQLLKPRGRFVVATMHAAFNSNNPVFLAELEETEGTVVETFSMKLKRYLSPATYQGTAIAGQPAAQYYFHRPLHELFNLGFDAGMVLNGFIEPQLEPPTPTARWAAWSRFREFPPVMVMRFVKI